MNVDLTEAERIKILNSNDLYGIMQRILLRENKIDRDREHFWVVGLANNQRILFIELVSKGTVNKTLVEPMEVFSFALQKRAVSIILVHNHPSGELRPSEPDKDVTDQLIQVGNIVGTWVMDHLIITETSYISFADTGLLDELRKSTKYVPPYKLQEQMKAEAESIGMQKGKEKGLKEGEKKGKMEIAKGMLAEGLDLKLIMKLTGLTKAQIEKL